MSSFQLTIRTWFSSQAKHTILFISFSFDIRRSYICCC